MDQIVSWKPEVIADNSGQWCGNALRFATEAEALANVANLAGRWMLVRETRAVPSSDPVNYRWIDGKLIAVEASPGFALEGETPAQAQSAAAAQAQAASEAARRAAAPAPESFELTGSDRAADAIPGHGDLFQGAA